MSIGAILAGEDNTHHQYSIFLLWKDVCKPFFFISVWEYTVTVLNADKLTLQLVRYSWSYLLIVLPNDFVFQSKKRNVDNRGITLWLTYQDPIVLSFFYVYFICFCMCCEYIICIPNLQKIGIAWITNADKKMIFQWADYHILVRFKRSYNTVWDQVPLTLKDIWPCQWHIDPM